MQVFVLWIIFAIVVGALANKRGRSAVGWFFLALIISPLISCIILLCIKDIAKEEIENKIYYEQLEKNRLEKEKIEIKRMEEERRAKEVQQRLNEQKIDQRKMSGSDFFIAINKLRNLEDKGIITENEYIGKKMKLIEDIKIWGVKGTCEDFLSSLIPLLDNETLSKEEIIEIKETIS